MRYPYMCPSCEFDFEIINSYSSEFDPDRSPERCPKCDEIAHRYIARSEFFGANDWNNQEYNPALGKLVRSNAHKKQILADFKARGRELEEIGNEPVEKIHSHFDKAREEKRMQRYADAERLKG